jgi:GNAT superfamily N-acetyltransferase
MAVIRRLRESDDLVALTALLHRAYAPHAAAGLRFLATHQPVETTRQRVAAGECWVAELAGVVVGTVMIEPHGPPERSRGCAFYDRSDVARFGQLGVEPDCKGRGIGRLLLDHVEARATELGAAWLACDTAEPATELRATYARRGYVEVDRADWRPTTNYPSVILALRLS